jgi:hypothetical protein
MPRSAAQMKRPLTTTAHSRLGWADLRRQVDEREAQVNVRPTRPRVPPSVDGDPVEAMPERYCGCGLPLEVDGRCPDGHFRGRVSRKGFHRW